MTPTIITTNVSTEYCPKLEKVKEVSTYLFSSYFWFTNCKSCILEKSSEMNKTILGNS